MSNDKKVPVRKGWDPMFTISIPLQRPVRFHHAVGAPGLILHEGHLPLDADGNSFIPPEWEIRQTGDFDDRTEAPILLAIPPMDWED